VDERRLRRIIDEAPKTPEGTARFAEAVFDLSTFTADVTAFTQSKFEGRASFDGVTFEADADFKGAIFGGAASFDRMTVRGRADLDGCHFKGSVSGHGIYVLGRLILSRALFEDVVQLEVGAESIRCFQTRFRAEVELEVRWAEIALEGAEFADRSLISSVPSSIADAALEKCLASRCHGAVDERGRPIVLEEQQRRRRESRTERARLVSLRSTGVQNLSLSGVDLRLCRFLGVHDLECLRIEEGARGLAVFSPAPHFGRHQILAEEHHWRSQTKKGKILFRGWYPPEVRPPDWLPNVTVPNPAQIAAIYRALRKGREDAKDEPGAGEFYFGEMEMRRCSRTHGRLAARLTSWTERLTISLYWTFSGYGLRPGRSFGVLIVSVTLATLGFGLYGFEDRQKPFSRPPTTVPTATTPTTVKPAAFPPGWGDIGGALRSGDAWTYAVATATPAVGGPAARLTQWGRSFRVALRILGPLFIGLTLLGIRGRVKR